MIALSEVKALVADLEAKLKAMGVDIQDKDKRLAGLHASLEELIEEHEEEPVDAQERAILENILKLHELTAADVMVPRVDIISAPGVSPPGIFRRGTAQALVTGRAVFRFDAARTRFTLASVHPGETVALIDQKRRESTPPSAASPPGCCGE